MPPTPRARIVVVGAGASGLAAAGELRRRGVQAVVLDKDERVGGTWARRYERLHLHTVRRFSGLPQVDIPADYGRYVHKDLYARYLADYAERLGLDLRLGQKVRRIAPGWVVETASDEWHAEVVVVATGKYAKKRLPRWPGIEDFGGRVVHSLDYRTGRDYAGKRVLVVGAGNTGTEVAADLVEQDAARVAIAIRTNPPVTSREVLGVPAQIWGILLSPLPARLVEPVASRLRKLATRDLPTYGIGEAGWSPFLAHKPPVIDVGFLRELRAGRIHVRPDVARFEHGRAVFTDGTEEPFDVVVAATGFTTGLEDILAVPDVLDEHGLPREMQSRRHPGLYFMGFVETMRGQLFEANREARRLAAAVDAQLSRSAAEASSA
jgi:NADPH-dependent glutamate synthase beta subunit-like oxidoreductase